LNIYSYYNEYIFIRFIKILVEKVLFNEFNFHNIPTKPWLVEKNIEIES